MKITQKCLIFTKGQIVNSSFGRNGCWKITTKKALLLPSLALSKNETFLYYFKSFWTPMTNSLLSKRRHQANVNYLAQKCLTK